MTYNLFPNTMITLECVKILELLSPQFEVQIKSKELRDRIDVEVYIRTTFLESSKFSTNVDLRKMDRHLSPERL